MSRRATEGWSESRGSEGQCGQEPLYVFVRKKHVRQGMRIEGRLVLIISGL